MGAHDVAPELDPRLVNAIRERAGDAADNELFREFLAKGAAAAEERRAAELKRIEGPLKLLVSGLRTPAPDGCSQDEYHKLLRAFADTVMKDLGLSPPERLTLLQELPEPEREHLRRVYPAIFPGVYRDAMAELKDALADSLDAGTGTADECEMAAANRSAARALREQKDPSVEVRESRRTTRKALNRARGRVGLHPLPVPRPLLRSACQGARHRRAPGRKPIRRPGSRRTPAPTRGDPDPDGDNRPPAPSPGARRWHRTRGASSEQIAAHRRLTYEGRAAR